MTDILSYLKAELDDWYSDYGRKSLLMLKIGILLGHSRMLPGNSAEQIAVHDQIMLLLYKFFEWDGSVDDQIIRDMLLVAYHNRDQTETEQT